MGTIQTIEKKAKIGSGSVYYVLIREHGNDDNCDGGKHRQEQAQAQEASKRTRIRIRTRGRRKQQNKNEKR